MWRRGFIAVILAAAAIGSGATLADAAPHSLSIAVQRDANGDVWSSSGAFVDAGTMAETSAFFAGSSTTFHGFRTFTGERGHVPREVRCDYRTDLRSGPQAQPVPLGGRRAPGGF